MDRFSERFKYFRERLGLSQRALAEKLGVPSTAISKYEQERIKPSADLLTKIGLMGININWLLTGEGVMLRKAPLALVPKEEEEGEGEEKSEEEKEEEEKESEERQIEAISRLLAGMSGEERGEVYRYISEKKRQLDTERRIGELEKTLEGLKGLKGTKAG